MGEEQESNIVDRRAASRMGKDEPTNASDNEAPPAGADVPADVAGMSLDELRVALAAERERAEANLKHWQRAAADYQNLKRRSEQERGEATRFAQVALVINLLPIFDDLDRAMATVDAHLAGLNWVQGVAAIHRKFAGALQAMDVHEVEAEGKPFDPASHEAVGQAPGEEGRIVHVVQKGYQLGDRVVRPAMVIVGSGTNAGQQ